MAACQPAPISGRAGPDWVRFAHFASGVRSRLAASNPRSAIPGLRLPNWLRFARSTSKRRPHTTNALLQIPQPSQVWLCSAQFPSSVACGGAKLGSFCTLRPFVGWASPPDFCRRWPRLALFCRIGPRSRGRAPPGPAGDWVRISRTGKERRFTGQGRPAESLTLRVVVADAAAGPTPLIDVCRDPYVVQKPKLRHNFLHP
jgi:hypothetical protein